MANTETPFNFSHFLNAVLKTNVSPDRYNFVTVSLVVYIPITRDHKVKLYRGFGRSLLTLLSLILCYTGIRNLHCCTTTFTVLSYFILTMAFNIIKSFII